MHLSKRHWRNYDNLCTQQPEDYHSLWQRTCLSLFPCVCLLSTAADSCPNMAARPLCRETDGLTGHSSSHTDTDSQEEGGNSVSARMCFCDRSSGSVCSGEREREGEGWQSDQWDVISSPLGGIQVFARPDEERRKLNLSLLSRI